MWYFVAFLVGAWILYLIIDYVRSYPERKRLQAERRWIQGILGGFNAKAERTRIIGLLKENLPEGYQCRKKRGRYRRCNGILLKQVASGYRGDHYICTECPNIRVKIRMGRQAR